MTGCYPARVDLATGSKFGVLLAGDPKGLNPNEVTIAEVLKGAGYATGCFGKWHLGDQPEFLPTRQGFDSFFGIPYSHDIHPFHPRQSHFKFPPLPLLDQETVIEEDPDADLLTKRITEHAVEFIDANKDKPFFLYVPHPIPHKPLHVSDAFKKDIPPDIAANIAKEGEGQIDYRARDKIFRQAIAEIDWSVGQIIDALKRHQLERDTLVLFFSDNGPAIGSAGPLKGRKGSTFEGGMREATVAWWPGRITPGQDIAELMTSMDLLPTFAKLANSAVPSDRIIDGKDISPILLGEERAKSPHEAFFYHKGKALMAVRSGDWKLHLKQPALFNLKQDIGESKNVAKAHPEVVSRLRRLAKEFNAELQANIRPAAFVDNAAPLRLEK